MAKYKSLILSLIIQNNIYKPGRFSIVRQRHTKDEFGQTYTGFSNVRQNTVLSEKHFEEPNDKKDGYSP